MKEVRKSWGIVLLLCLLLGIGVRAQQRILTFEEAMRMMQEQNPALKQKKEQIRQKEYELQAKKGLRLPRVALNATAVTMADPLHLDLTPVSEAIAPIYSTLGTYGVFSGVPNPDPNTNSVMPVLPDELSTQVVREKMLEAGQHIEDANWDQIIQEKSFARVSAGFTMPIYAGGKINSANRAAKVDLEISKQQLRQAEGVLLKELVTRYYGLALGVRVVELREEMLRSMENHYQNAQKLFDNGMIAKVELLHAQVAAREAERELMQARRNVEILRTALQATLASDSLGAVMPGSGLFINADIAQLKTLIDQAPELNPQMQQIEGKKRLVEIKHHVEVGEYLPTIAAMGDFNLVDKDFSPYMPDWLVGVGMQWTLFEGMSRKNKVKASETLRHQVQFAEEKATADLKTYLTKLYQQLQNQQEQKNELDVTLELAEEYKRSTEKAFEEGFATSTDVVEANTKVLQVKTKQLSVLYQYDVTLAGFLQTAGTPERFVAYAIQTGEAY